MAERYAEVKLREPADAGLFEAEVCMDPSEEPREKKKKQKTFLDEGWEMSRGEDSNIA